MSSENDIKKERPRHIKKKANRALFFTFSQLQYKIRIDRTYLCYQVFHEDWD